MKLKIIPALLLFNLTISIGIRALNDEPQTQQTTNYFLTYVPVGVGGAGSLILNYITQENIIRAIQQKYPNENIDMIMKGCRVTQVIFTLVGMATGWVAGYLCECTSRLM